MPTPSDKPLRHRVKLLGQLLGETLRDREGRPVLDAVETLRQGFIELRGRSEPAPDLRDRLLRFIAALNPETLNHVVRAFNAPSISPTSPRRIFSACRAASRYGAANRYGGVPSRSVPARARPGETDPRRDCLPVLPVGR